MIYCPDYCMPIAMQLFAKRSQSMKTSKLIISLGLSLLALTSVTMLVTASLDTYQYCFVFGTMCASAVIFLLINK